MSPAFPALPTPLEPHRLFLIPAAWSAVLAAHLIATGGHPQWWVLLAHLAAVTALYPAGLLFHEALARAGGNRPAGGPGSPRQAWIQGGALLAAGLGLAALAGGESLRVAAGLGLTLLASAGFLKGSVLGPLVVGATRYATWTLGFTVVATGAGLQLLALPVFLYTAALAVLSGADLPDADRQAPARRAAAGLAANLLVATLVLCIALVGGGRLGQPLVLAGVALGAAPLILGLRRLRRDGSAARARTLVQWFALGLIPLDALLVIGTGDWVSGVVVLLLAPAAWWQQRRPSGA